MTFSKTDFIIFAFLQKFSLAFKVSHLIPLYLFSLIHVPLFIFSQAAYEFTWYIFSLCTSCFPVCWEILPHYFFVIIQNLCCLVPWHSNSHWLLKSYSLYDVYHSDYIFLYLMFMYVRLIFPRKLKIILGWGLLLTLSIPQCLNAEPKVYA